jgi:hypothetical protein
MKRRSLMATVVLSASLLAPLAGCGGAEEYPLPPEENLSTPQPPDVSLQAASPEAQAALGVQSWRLLEPEGDRARVEGLDSSGRVVLSAVSSPSADGYILDVTTPAPMSFRVDSSFRLLDGDSSNPVFASLYRDLLTPRVDPAARPPLDVSDFDLTAAPESLAAESGSVKAFATDAERDRYRFRLTCDLQAANEAYNSVDGRPSLCGLYYMRDVSTNVLKVWSKASFGTRTHTITIGFAGTRPTYPGDIGRDFQSQAYATHTTPLASSIPYGTMYVGNGFEARWDNQAATGLATFLRDAIKTNLDRGYKMRVFVAGHSLGGVTATLAGFDIDGMLAKSGVTYSVTVTAFNPPRLGWNNARYEYQKRLFTTCNEGDFGRNQSCLVLRQMTRTGDPVHGLPLGFSHPVWQTANNAIRGVGPGPYGNNAELPYCSQYHAPRRSWVNPNANHDLAAWGTNIANIPNSHLDCMFLPNIKKN